jgi:hypothetical protein
MNSFPLPFQKFLWKLLDLVKSLVNMGSFSDNVYLLGRDEVETKRYVALYYTYSMLFRLAYGLHHYTTTPLHCSLHHSLHFTPFLQFNFRMSHSNQSINIVEDVTDRPLPLDTFQLWSPDPTVWHTPLSCFFFTLTLYSLNNQHRFLVAISDNNIIHPSIPNHINAIADLGTGTGYVHFCRCHTKPNQITASG